MMLRLVIIIVGGLIALSAVTAANAAPWNWNGEVHAGGIWLDEVGNESTMPETYNIHNGIVLSSFHLQGQSNSRQYLTLDLTDINLDNRKGVFDYRRTGTMHFRSRFTKSRWVFDPTGNVDAGRSDWANTLSWTPRKSLRFSADYNLQTRDGNRIDLNPGYEGWLGTEYNSKLHRYRLEGQANAKNGIGGMLAYDGVMQRDALDTHRERDGYVLSANIHIPGYYVKTLTHVVQAAIGRSEIRESGLGFDMINFQYTGVWQARGWMRWRYRFYGSQVEDEATTIRTNNYFHDFDGTFGHRNTVLTLGYGWEELDGDRAQSSTNKFRGALSLRDPYNRFSGRIAFDGRNRDDEQNTTLLRDSENRRWDIRLNANPYKALALGARLSDRHREYPDLGLESFGYANTVYATWTKAITVADIPASITELGAEYTYADDEYDNLWGKDLRTVSKTVTGRIGLTLWDDLNLKGSFTYLDMDEDLDLRKSIISVGAAYRFKSGLLANVKYNVYNYDDYLLIDRFYTANVVWLTVGHEFSTK